MQFTLVPLTFSKETQNVSEISEEASKLEAGFDLLVFSHLKWDFVYQRPHHLISGFSDSYRILFVEEPTFSSNSSDVGIKTYVVNPQITILQSKGIRMVDLGAYLRVFLGTQLPSIAWFYSAAFVPILNEFKFNAIIYDCMDELSLFKHTDHSLILKEEKLLLFADVVFTGGKSLYEAKRKLHSNVYCFPSSVDAHHFEKALNGISIPNDVKDIKGPVVGYYGVIDERIDLELIRDTASENPEVHFVLIGPIAKISNEDLPHAENIHYLGMKSYNELPGYLKRFDIAMMPFALNDSTKFINPTKTLEYMAAGKPIISTRIEDVVKDYSDKIELINDAKEFSEKIKEILLFNTRNRSAQYVDILKKTSWSNTVKEMKSIIKSLC